VVARQKILQKIYSHEWTRRRRASAWPWFILLFPNDQYLALGKSNGRLFVLGVQQVLERFASNK
jgi:hypothetical protein